MNKIKPLSWDGEGLPPVGCECEVMYIKDTDPVWHKCKIKYISTIVNTVGVLAIKGREYTFETNYWRNKTVQFRKLETEEDKAKKAQDDNTICLLRVYVGIAYNGDSGLIMEPSIYLERHFPARLSKSRLEKLSRGRLQAYYKKYRHLRGKFQHNSYSYSLSDLAYNAEYGTNVSHQLNEYLDMVKALIDKHD